jgi:hypothetical protein
MPCQALCAFCGRKIFRWAFRFPLAGERVKLEKLGPEMVKNGPKMVKNGHGNVKNGPKMVKKAPEKVTKCSLLFP